MQPLNPAYKGTPGTISWDDKWPETEKVKAVLTRLRALGVHVQGSRRSDVVGYELRIGMDETKNYIESELVEIGFLIAQLNNADYPNDYFVRNPDWGICAFSSFKSNLRIDVDPEFLRFEVYLKSAK